MPWIQHRAMNVIEVPSLQNRDLWILRSQCPQILLHLAVMDLHEVAVEGHTPVSLHLEGLPHGWCAARWAGEGNQEARGTEADELLRERITSYGTALRSGVFQRSMPESKNYVDKDYLSVQGVRGMCALLDSPCSAVSAFCSHRRNCQHPWGMVHSTT